MTRLNWLVAICFATLVSTTGCPADDSSSSGDAQSQCENTGDCSDGAAYDDDEPDAADGSEGIGNDSGVDIHNTGQESGIPNPDGGVSGMWSYPDTLVEIDANMMKDASVKDASVDASVDPSDGAMAFSAPQDAALGSIYCKPTISEDGVAYCTASGRSNGKSYYYDYPNVKGACGELDEALRGNCCKLYDLAQQCQQHCQLQQIKPLPTNTYYSWYDEEMAALSLGGSTTIWAQGGSMKGAPIQGCKAGYKQDAQGDWGIDYPIMCNATPTGCIGNAFQRIGGPYGAGNTKLDYTF